MIQLTESGGTLGFTIQPAILLKLDLSVKDLVTIRILDNKGEQLAEFARPLKKMGKGSFGVTIRHYVVKKLELNLKDVIPVDILKPG